MRNKIVLVIAILIMAAGMSSCTMHNIPGVPKQGWSMNGSTRHYGVRKHANGRKAFWGKKRYGPRSHYYRGRYRQKCGL